jgi:biotin operon repressor
MAATSNRTLRLLSLLQARRFWAGGDLAGRLEVSLRTLRRDVDRLRELGYPVEARPGVDGGYSLAPGAALPPLVLDDDEAVALAVGLQAAAQTPVAGMAESSVQALAKVVQVMPARLRRRVDALRAVTVPAGWGTAAPLVDPAVLTTLALACRDAERVRFRYTDGAGARSERLVEPFRLVQSGRRWYLVAYDDDRGAGAVSGSTGSTRPPAPAAASHRGGSRPRTPRHSCGTASTPPSRPYGSARASPCPPRRYGGGSGVGRRSSPSTTAAAGWRWPPRTSSGRSSRSASPAGRSSTSTRRNSSTRCMPGPHDSPGQPDPCEIADLVRSRT